jgi:hypothetical protein
VQQVFGQHPSQVVLVDDQQLVEELWERRKVAQVEEVRSGAGSVR